MIQKKLLTLERLNGEYLTWSLNFDDGRNDSDLRFSQYIDLMYEHDVHAYLDDPFYYESATKVYHTLVESIRLHNIQNTL